MNKEEITNVLSKIEYKDWACVLWPERDYFLFAWEFMEQDVTKPNDKTLYKQECRKYYIANDATETDVIRTVWLALQQAVMHEVAESFLYNGVRLFDPHTNYVSLSEYMHTHKCNMEKEKFKEHPYFSDYNIIISAFNSLINDQKNIFKTLRDYKGALCEKSIQQLNWENERIEEVKKIVLNKYING